MSQTKIQYEVHEDSLIHHRDTEAQIVLFRVPRSFLLSSLLVPFSFLPGV
jgi:hypothetical protein